MNGHQERAWETYCSTLPGIQEGLQDAFLAGWSAAIGEAISICKEEFVGLPGSRMPDLPVPRDLRTIDRLQEETMPD